MTKASSEGVLNCHDFINIWESFGRAANVALRGSERSYGSSSVHDIDSKPVN